jgi:UDP-2,3-diacylglucosamine pyrophosphatase LpxH
MINDRDWQYRFWRKASKNPVSKLGVNLIPGRMARNFVDDVEARLSKSNFKHKSVLPVDLMKAYGRKRAAEGFTDVILGHFHEKKTIDAAPATVTILPPWYETGEAMAIDLATGAYEFVTV